MLQQDWTVGSKCQISSRPSSVYICNNKSHKSKFFWRRKSRLPERFALLLAAGLTIDTFSSPSPCANGWDKKSRANSSRESLTVTWAISSTSHTQLNISLSLWHKAAEAQERQGPVLWNLGTRALLWPTKSTPGHLVSLALLLPNCQLFQMLSPLSGKSKFCSFVKFTQLPKPLQFSQIRIFTF